MKRIYSVITILILMFLLCSCGKFPLRFDVAMDTVDRHNQLKYFTEYQDTDEIVNVEEGSIRKGYCYTGDSFVFEGDTYVKIKPQAVYQDIHRKRAVVNLYDGKNKMTAYEYDYPEDLHVLNVSEFLYCREDDLEELYAFYSDPDRCKFTYKFVYMVPDRNDKIVVEIFDDIVFDGKKFEALAEGDPSVCDKVKNVIRRSKPVNIKQYTEDTYMIRGVEFYRTEGEVYMIIFNHMAKDGTDMDVHNCYHVTDPEVVSYINGKMDECNTILADKYGHTEKEY